MLYNLSRNVAATRDFFITYADRILFGTDADSDLSPTETDARASLVRRWLETDETYRVPTGAHFVLGPAAAGVVRGLALPEETLGKILQANFVRLAGAKPAVVDREAAIDESERIAAPAQILAGPSGAAPAREALRRLRG